MYSTSPNNSSNEPQPQSFIGRIASHKGPLIGSGLTLPSTAVAQLAGQSDCDFVMIDMEHSPMTIDVVTQMVHAFVASSNGTKFPLIRVPSHGVEWIKWALDCGAAGIIIPMVNNADEMKAILDRALYPPLGRRSFGPLNAPFARPQGAAEGVGGYFQRAKRGEIAILPMIESKEGLDNAEAILSLGGVSGTFIGPADLRLSLCLTVGVDGSEPAFLHALSDICAIGKKHRKVVGCMGMGEIGAGSRAAEGMDFLIATADSSALVSGMAADIASARKGIRKAQESL